MGANPWLVPELPEVETVRRQVAPSLRGRRMESVRVFVGRMASPDADTVARLGAGRRIEDVLRRGKQLYMPLDDGRYFLLHLGMTGSLLIEPSGGDAPLPAHSRALVELDDAHRLVLVDPRTFGAVAIAEDLGFLARYGPEPLDAGYDPLSLARVLAVRRAPIKSLLLDQHLVAGIGSIYADESLFLAGIHPLAPAGDVGVEALARLAAILRDVLVKAVDARGATFEGSRYRDTFGVAGELPTAVYGREGSPCPRCGTTVVRGRMGRARKARSFHCCPRCQPDGSR